LFKYFAYKFGRKSRPNAKKLERTWGSWGRSSSELGVHGMMEERLKLPNRGPGEARPQMRSLAVA